MLKRKNNRSFFKLFVTPQKTVKAPHALTVFFHTVGHMDSPDKKRLH